MKLLRRLAASLTAARRRRESAEELATHLSLLTDDLIAQGLPPHEARRRARLTLGSPEAACDHIADQRGLPLLDNLLHDLRYALRGFRRNPLFTATALACLALGIGANTAVFSLFNAVMLRSLPVHDPARLVFFKYTPADVDISPLRRLSSGYSNSALPYSVFEAFQKARSLNGPFVFVAPGIQGNALTLSIDGRALAADGEMVSAAYFSTLGVQPLLGRAILPADLAPNAPPVAVISHRLWTREFNSNPNAPGRRITINGEPFTVAGVAPPSFAGLLAPTPDIWLPLRPSPAIRPWGSRNQSHFSDSTYWWTTIAARLAPGVTPQQAQAELDPLFQQAITANAPSRPKLIPHIELSPSGPIFDNYRRRLATSLRILLATAAIVLFIACSNLAALLTARARARRREFAIRLSIGASRARLVAQLLTESLLLSTLGAALGLLIAAKLAPALLTLLLGNARTTPIDVSPNLSVLAFTLALALLTGLAFGLAPALRATQSDLSPRLKSKPHAAPLLLASQIALSVVLLYSAGLFLRTLSNLNTQDLGFDRDQLLLFDIDPERSGYQAPAALALHARILNALQSLPGVRSATLSEYTLLSGWSSTTPATTDGPPLPAGRPTESHYNRIGPAFFETMQMKIVAGRPISAADIAAARPVAVVNQTWARDHYPNLNPIGRRFSFSDRKLDPAKAFEIVGVAADAKFERIRETPPRTVFLAYSARWERPRRLTYALRAPSSLLPAVTQTIRTIDPNLPIFNLKTQAEQIDQALGQERLLARASTFFSALALLLVAVGLYGALSFNVSQRSAELAIRIALGARRASLVRLVLANSLFTAALGLAAGIPAALALARLAQSSLYGVKAHDPLTLAVTAAILALIAAAAALAPAARAAKTDPLTALRAD